MKTPDLEDNLFDIIYEDELREITKSFSALLLMTKLHNIDDQKLASFINGMVTAYDLLENEGQIFTLNTHLSNIRGSVRKQLSGNLRLALYPKTIGVQQFVRVWIISFTNQENYSNYSKKKSERR
jgi:hypothetical protein